ncbi:hypothetical protein GEM_1043 [Burkholderia cepacia GG4]|uniref:Uncharacterized protein n=1 Tax=Burkholderia cepacia GG4 TaxID=1009846 RepID=A0A9W3P8K5_BURCE|nr:hypothetical protein GEM_1043 [Burkholderia cepacia GG4]
MALLHLSALVSAKRKYVWQKSNSSLPSFRRRIPGDVKPLLAATGSPHAEKPSHRRRESGWCRWKAEASRRTLYRSRRQSTSGCRSSSMKSMHRTQRLQVRRTMSMRPQRSAVPVPRCRRRRHMRQGKGRARQTSPDRLYAYAVPRARVGAIVSTRSRLVNEIRAPGSVPHAKRFVILFAGAHGRERQVTARQRNHARLRRREPRRGGSCPRAAAPMHYCVTACCTSFDACHTR